jgi:hypothetical protein
MHDLPTEPERPADPVPRTVPVLDGAGAHIGYTTVFTNPPDVSDAYVQDLYERLAERVDAGCFGDEVNATMLGFTVPAIASSGSRDCYDIPCGTLPSEVRRTTCYRAQRIKYNRRFLKRRRLDDRDSDRFVARYWPLKPPVVNRAAYRARVRRRR